jgi:hypothetical protein
MAFADRLAFGRNGRLAGGGWTADEHFLTFVVRAESRRQDPRDLWFIAPGQLQRLLAAKTTV